jgi:electron transport complex protein RnfC
VGTKLRDLLAYCGGLTAVAEEVQFGGPMMGQAQSDFDVPLLKGTTGVVVLTHDEVRAQAQSPCIHCGRCLEACPMFLNPTLLGDLARVGRYDEMAEAHLADCMLCGSCSYVCPSNIPLAQLFSASKAALRRQAAAKPVGGAA